MRIAIINEASASSKNPDIVAAIEACGQEMLNIGMQGFPGKCRSAKPV